MHITLRSLVSIAALSFVGSVSTGCATDLAMSIGPHVDAEVRDVLEEASVESVTLIDGDRAFWIGPDALTDEVSTLVEALLDAPQAERDGHKLLPGHPHSRMTLRNVPGDDILVFHHSAAMIDFAVGPDETDFVRVIRISIDATPQFEVWTWDDGDDHAVRGTLLTGTADIEAAWSALARGAVEAADDRFLGTTNASTERGPPRSPYLLRAGVEIRRTPK